MPLFKKSKSILTRLKQNQIKAEKDIQALTERNISEIFGLVFVKTEYQLNKLRIDTLAFDDETKSFVIIEYKKNRSFSVVDQGFAYLSLMLNNKADFILEYNECCKGSLHKDDVDWSQSRVIFVAPSFTIHQQNAINFKDLPIELWEIQEFDDGLVLFNQLIAKEESESIDTITTSTEVKQVSREIKKFTIDDHFKSGWEDMKELYHELENRLLEIDPHLVVDPKKYYIGFKIDNMVLFDVKAYKSKLVLELCRVMPKDLDDPKGLTKYRKNSFKYYNKHISHYVVKSEEDIEYGTGLARQVYNQQIG